MSDDVKTEMASQVMGVALLLGKDKSDIGAASAGASEAEIFATLSRVTCNTFNVLGVGGAYEEVVGLGVYATPSLLNHSCDPNCVVVFRGRELLVRSVLPVSKGEQVRIGGEGGFLWTVGGIVAIVSSLFTLGVISTSNFSSLVTNYNGLIDWLLVRACSAAVVHLLL